MLVPVLIHPRAQGTLVDTQLAGDFGGRPLGLDHHLHRLFAVFRSELTIFRHNDPSSSGDILPYWVTVRWEPHTPHRRARLGESGVLCAHQPFFPDSICTVWEKCWQIHLHTPEGPHIGAINRTTTGHIPKPLPRARGPARRRRLHRRRQHHPSPHPLRNPQLPMSRRPPADAWTVLAVDSQDRRQDRHPPTQPDRSRALPG